MSFFKKLHIKILGVALLVTLISYNTDEVRMLPQQFTSEHVVFTKDLDSATAYFEYGIIENSTSLDYTVFNFSKALDIYNARQNFEFELMNAKSNSLKKTRRIKSFLPRILLSKDTRPIII